MLPELYKYHNLIKAKTPYALKMKALSNQIFGELVRETNCKSMKVYRLFSEKPLYKLDYMVSYYPRHQETGHLMTRLRKYGLFRDEHQDFVDEMTRLRTLRGKVRRVGKKSTTLLTADTKS